MSEEKRFKLNGLGSDPEESKEKLKELKKNFRNQEDSKSSGDMDSQEGKNKKKGTKGASSVKVEVTVESSSESSDGENVVEKKEKKVENSSPFIQEETESLQKGISESQVENNKEVDVNTILDDFFDEGFENKLVQKRAIIKKENGKFNKEKTVKEWRRRKEKIVEALERYVNTKAENEELSEMNKKEMEEVIFNNIPEILNGKHLKAGKILKKLICETMGLNFYEEDGEVIVGKEKTEEEVMVKDKSDKKEDKKMEISEGDEVKSEKSERVKESKENKWRGHIPSANDLILEAEKKGADLKGKIELIRNEIGKRKRQIKIKLKHHLKKESISKKTKDFYEKAVDAKVDDAEKAFHKSHTQDSLDEIARIYDDLNEILKSEEINKNNLSPEKKVEKESAIELKKNDRWYPDEEAQKNGKSSFKIESVEGDEIEVKFFGKAKGKRKKFLRGELEEEIKKYYDPYNPEKAKRNRMEKFEKNYPSGSELYEQGDPGKENIVIKGYKPGEKREKDIVTIETSEGEKNYYLDKFYEDFRDFKKIAEGEDGDVMKVRSEELESEKGTSVKVESEKLESEEKEYGYGTDEIIRPSFGESNFVSESISDSEDENKEGERKEQQEKDQEKELNEWDKKVLNVYIDYGNELKNSLNEVMIQAKENGDFEEELSNNQIKIDVKIKVLEILQEKVSKDLLFKKKKQKAIDFIKKNIKI